MAKTSGPLPPFHPKFFPPPSEEPHREEEEEGQGNGCALCNVKNAPFYVCMIETVFIASVLAIFIQHYLSMEEQRTELTLAFTFALMSAVLAFCLVLSLVVGLCLSRKRIY